MLTTRSLRLLLLAPALAAAGCALSSEPRGDGEPTASAAEAVETQYAGPGTYDPDTSSPANNAVLAATGALFVPLHHGSGAPWLGTDGTPTVASCGLTFISSHYAVTAAHCVDGTDLPTTSTMFTVQQYDLSAVPWSTVEASSNETGPYLSYSPAYTFNQLTPAQGYKVTQYNQCHVAARCAYGNVACAANADVALVRCDDRPWFSAALPVASSDAQQGEVSMEWFHEFYSSMPITQPLLGFGTFGRMIYWHNEDRYQHYTLYPPVAPASEGPDQYLWDQNFHYYGNVKNQILPMMSMTYKDGDLFFSPRRLGKDPSMDVVWTDLYGCHGTSGSGILQWVWNGSAYTAQLLGPVSNASTQSGLGSNLCDTFSGMAGMGQPQLGYPLLQYTQTIAQLAAGDWPWWIGRLGTTAEGAAATPPSLPAPAPAAATHLYAGGPVQTVHLR